MKKNNDEFQEVFDQLSTLAPTEQERPTPAPLMLSRIKREIDQTAEQKNTAVWSTLFSSLFTPGRRWALSAVLLFVLFVAGFSSPTLRAAASDFLGQFRVQKFAAISISPDQLAVLEEVAQSGVRPGALQFVEQPGDGTAVDSLREAAVLTGSPVQTLPALGNPDTIVVTDGGSAIFTVDIEASRELLTLANIDPDLLPAELDNADIRIFIYDGILQQWANGTTLVQTVSPIVEYPPGIDPNLLGKALLQLLGLTDAEAARLAEQIDWTSTLVLPVPTDVGTFEEVTVQGVSGLYISSTEGGSGLIWQKEGSVYVLTSDGGKDALVAQANQVE